MATILRSTIMMASPEAGDAGNIQVLSRHEQNKCIAIVYRMGGDMPCAWEALIESENAAWEEGAYRILEISYEERRCIMEITERSQSVPNGNVQPFNVTLDLNGCTNDVLQQ
jgi:hypothetical protein